MKRGRRIMRIGELETISGCSRDTIHFYVRSGLLLAPTRTSATTAEWTDLHLDALARIRTLRAHGVPLPVVQRVLEHDPAASLDRLDALGALLAALGVRGSTPDDGDAVATFASVVRERLVRGESPAVVCGQERERALDAVRARLDAALEVIAIERVLGCARSPRGG